MTLPVSGGSVIGVPYQGSHKPGATSPASWESDNAVDIAVPVGTPIYAVEDGVIGPQFGSLGSTSPALAGLRLHLNPTTGPSIYYAHLSEIAPGIRPGSVVHAGQLLGYSGSANGVAHLHFATSTGSPFAFLGNLPGKIADAVSGNGSSGSSASTSAALPTGCGGVLLILAVVVAAGAIAAHAWARAGSPGWLVTAYCLRGTTATGDRVAPGVVAVDPAVIPLHSRVYVDGYGYGRALDTGSAVRGRHVDVWLASCARALRFTHYGPVRWWRR